MNTISYKSNFSDSPITMFDDSNGVISISGRAIQIDSSKFWNSMNSKLNEFLQNSLEKVSIRFQMEYIHSSSIESLLRFLELLKLNTKKDKCIEVEWLYENGDEDMLELGNFINEIVKLPMKYIKMNHSCSC